MRCKKIPTIHRFSNGKIIRQATKDEFKQYLAEISVKTEEQQLSGEVDGTSYGIKGLIYMQDFPIGGLCK